MCPHCRSSKLKIKAFQGIERVIVLLTGKRKYRCLDCDHGFRSIDRRRVSREFDARAVVRPTRSVPPATY